MFDLYKANRSDSERYILGKNGERKIIVIGLNPSTATQEKSDTTVAKVHQTAVNFGFDGFVMANLYPLRSTCPDNLPDKAKCNALKRNIEALIECAETEENPLFWAAWGVHIAIRRYLFDSLHGLNKEIQKLNGSWVCYGNLTQSGHPRHPCRLSYNWKFQEFAINLYLDSPRKGITC